MMGLRDAGIKGCWDWGMLGLRNLGIENAGIKGMLGLRECRPVVRVELPLFLCT
jgi:hypothetical protein